MVDRRVTKVSSKTTMSSSSLLSKNRGNTTRSNTGAEKNTKTRCLVINNRSSGMGVVKWLSLVARWNGALPPRFVRTSYLLRAIPRDVSRGTEKNKLSLNLLSSHLWDTGNDSFLNLSSFYNIICVQNCEIERYFR